MHTPPPMSCICCLLSCFFPLIFLSLSPSPSPRSLILIFLLRIQRFVQYSLCVSFLLFPSLPPSFLLLSFFVSGFSASLFSHFFFWCLRSGLIVGATNSSDLVRKESRADRGKRERWKNELCVFLQKGRDTDNLK